MPVQTYQRQDAVGTLYDNMVTPITSSSGNSAVLPFSFNDGVPESEIAIAVRDITGTGALVLDLYDDRSGSMAFTGWRFVVPGNGDYVWPIDNRVVQGKNVRLTHAWTAGNDANGFLMHAHLRNRTLAFG